MSIAFTPILEPYVHGVEATKGDRKAEVVRVYEAEWTTFCYVNGRPCKGDKQNVSKQAALKLATRFLNGDYNPEVWPETPAK